MDAKDVAPAPSSTLQFKHLAVVLVVVALKGRGHFSRWLVYYSEDLVLKTEMVVNALLWSAFSFG